MRIGNKIFISYLIVALTLGFVVLYDSKVFKEELAYCAVQDFGEGLVDEEKIREGKKLFKSLCASCHKLNKKLVGPALGGLEMDSVRLYKYLISKKHTPTFPQLTQENIIEILKYTK